MNTPKHKHPGRPKLTRAQRLERARLVALTVRVEPRTAERFAKLCAVADKSQSATFAELVEKRAEIPA